MKPLTTPKHTAISSASTIASAMCMPPAIKLAAVMLEMAITEPTDRSIPPPVMTTVIPSATVAEIELCRRIFSKFLCERKLFAWIEKNAISMISPSKMPDLFWIALNAFLLRSSLSLLPSKSCASSPCRVTVDHFLRQIVFVSIHVSHQPALVHDQHPVAHADDFWQF